MDDDDIVRIATLIKACDREPEKLGEQLDSELEKLDRVNGAGLGPRAAKAKWCSFLERPVLANPG